MTGAALVALLTEAGYIKGGDVSAELSTFGEMVEVLDTLPVILRNARRARRVSVREVGRQTDLSFSTVSRVENGEECCTSRSTNHPRSWTGRCPYSTS